MSNIPSSAVAAAFVPVQQSTNELIRARQVQSRKNNHHQEDVEELDDTAVDSVSDERQEGEKREGKGRKRQEGEKVDIESLKDGPPPTVKRAEEPASHLDISA
jgi:hypothetical protein